MANPPFHRRWSSELQAVVSALAAVADDVHEGAVREERQSRIIGVVGVAVGDERHGARWQRVEVLVNKQLPRRRSDVADAQAHVARDLAFDRYVVLVDIGRLQDSGRCPDSRSRRGGGQRATRESVLKLPAAARVGVPELVAANKSRTPCTATVG